MPSTYVRKSERQSWSEEAMAQALEALRNRSYGFLKAAKIFGVPKSTLERRFKNKNKNATEHTKILGSRKLTFPVELEQQLVEYVKNMESMLYGLTTKSIRSLAYQLAVKNNLKHHFNNESKLAGWHWLHSFLKRNKLSLRLPEATSAARARGFNKKAVASFFDIIEPLQEKFHFPLSRIFNVDETGITTVQGRPSKVIAVRGRKQVGSLTYAERGELSTAVICMSASGVFVPPMLIFPRVRMKPQFLDGAPPETLGLPHKSGWMQMDLFDKWFDHFLIHTQPSKDNPALLILDGHKTHTQNISIIDKARENGVTILCLPPHCSHRMQPLDVSFMAPLSTFYTQEVEVWLRNHPGRCVTISEVASLFGKAYLRASTPLYAINGFSKTGLFPMNRFVFTEDMFAASLPTDKPLENADTSRNTPNCTSLSEEEFVGESTPEQQIIQKPTLSEIKPKTDTSVQDDSLPSTSSSSFVRPDRIAPYPKAKVPKKQNKSRKRGKAAVLTSSPYKNELEISMKEKARKSNSRANVKKIQSTTKIKFLQEKRSCSMSSETKRVKHKKMLECSSDSEADDNDVECLFCSNNYSKDQRGEGWIRCCSCNRWAHDACAGVASDDDEFTCDLCR